MLWTAALYVCSDQVGIADSGGVTYEDLMRDGWQILRPANAMYEKWEDCSKSCDD